LNSAAPVAPPFSRRLIKYAIGLVIMAAILLVISGRPGWSRAWLFTGCCIGAQIAVGHQLHRRSPDLLQERSRIQAGTKSWDRILAPLVALGPLALWAVAALDIRAHWPPPVPVWWSAVALVVCLLGIAFTGWAMLSNRFFAGTVRIQSDRGHVVVDRGPYRIVRHPGYLGALVFTLASPVALGSWWAVVPAVLVVAVLIVRTALEDRVLRAELEGYAAYAGRIRSRLLPGIW
jgi:protein-S-isoprenylcysteine O-methyltransferase Ste14